MSGSANQDFQTPHRQPLRTNLPLVYRPPGSRQPQLSNRNCPIYRAAVGESRNADRR